MTFRTSGSTGQPKSCAHTLDAMWQEPQALASLISGCSRLFAAVPSHQIYGFRFTILLPRALKLDSGSILDLRQSSPARLSRGLSEGDVIIGHPEFWRMVSRAVPALSPTVVGVTSTAPFPIEVDASLKAAGLTKMLQIYGSSETAGVGWRTCTSEPYTLFLFWRRETVYGNTLLREGASTGIAAPDVLAWQSEQCFLPVGRVDHAVQVCGINVFSQRVQRELQLHLDVADVAVRLMRLDEGNRLKVFVVPRDLDTDVEVLALDLMVWMGQKLCNAELPRSLTFGKALPTDQEGELVDWVMASSSLP